MNSHAATPLLPESERRVKMLAKSAVSLMDCDGMEIQEYHPVLNECCDWCVGAEATRSMNAVSTKSNHDLRSVAATYIADEKGQPCRV